MKRLPALVFLAILLVPGLAFARYYNAGEGRFLSLDQYEGNQSDAPSLHRYCYAKNNPLRYWDPNGMEVKDVKNPRLKTAVETIEANPKYGTLITWLRKSPHTYEFRAGEAGGDFARTAPMAERVVDGTTVLVDPLRSRLR